MNQHVLRRVGPIIIPALLLGGGDALPAMARPLSVPALYRQAFQQLPRVARFELRGSAEIDQGSKKLVKEDLRYVAPNRVSLTIHSNDAASGTLEFDTIQVATTKCQRPPGWLCFHSAPPDPAALASSLITPKLQKPVYTLKAASMVLDGKRQSVTQIGIRGKQSKLTYSATLTITSSRHLPVRFTSSVVDGSTVVALQSIHIVYGGTFAIRLPKGTGVQGVNP